MLYIVVWTKRTLQSVFDRDKRCVVCGTVKNLDKPHHCLYRSEYFGSDRDGAWNLVTICIKCHFNIHHGVGFKEVRERLRTLALRRR